MTGALTDLVSLSLSQSPSPTGKVFSKSHQHQSGEPITTNTSISIIMEYNLLMHYFLNSNVLFLQLGLTWYNLQFDFCFAFIFLAQVSGL